MNVYETGSLSQKLSTNTYPGRGIVLGVYSSYSLAITMIITQIEKKCKRGYNLEHGKI